MRKLGFISGLILPVIVLAVSSVSAKTLISADKALIKHFGKTADISAYTVTLMPEQMSRIEQVARITFVGQHASSVRLYKVLEQGKVKGFALEDVVQGKWGPIHYLLCLSPKGIIEHTVILDYKEIRGKPIAKRRFLKQYQRKSVRDPVMLRQDIDGISGATISSTSLTDGIRKLLFIFRELNLINSTVIP